VPPVRGAGEPGRRGACEMLECNGGVGGEVAGVALTQADVAALLDPERTFRSKAGKRFTVRLRLDPANGTHLTFVFPERATPTALEGVTRSRDGHPIVVRDIAYGCSRRNDEAGQWCPVVIWREVAGHIVTPNEARALIAGETVGPSSVRVRPVRRFGRGSVGRPTTPCDWCLTASRDGNEPRRPLRLSDAGKEPVTSKAANTLTEGPARSGNGHHLVVDPVLGHACPVGMSSTAKGTIYRRGDSASASTWSRKLRTSRPSAARWGPFHRPWPWASPANTRCRFGSARCCI
jgi:hypothetical protein